MNRAEGDDVDTIGSLPDTVVRVSQYIVSAVPEEVTSEAHLWDITVEYRGKGRWAVKHLSSCYDADGETDWEPIPSSREDDWLDRFRHTEEEALRIARMVAPIVSVNGWTPTAILAKHGVTP